ncbi:MAG: hypothetical protein CSB03_00845 [Bacteroidia bacterium]|nr:MAG: hypothetical protein CSB03_00845 [Bacteroidia bacterium]
MKKISILMFLCICSLSAVFAGNTRSNSGARAVALGQSSISFRDLWAVANNQAGIAFLKRPVLGVAYEERFRMKEMSLKTVAFALPTNRIGNFGASFTYFGDTEYNESRINLAYGRMLGEHFAMGVAFDYIGMSVEGNSESASAGTVTGELGIMAEPIENLWLSAHVYNPFGVKISEANYEEKLPTLLRFGALYHFDEDLLFVAEIEKDIDYDVRVKAGVEYTVLDKFIFRGGIATKPTEYSGGFGLRLKSFCLDLTHRI